jgi:hypothetical protein
MPNPTGDVLPNSDGRRRSISQAAEKSLESEFESDSVGHERVGTAISPAAASLPTYALAVIVWGSVGGES